jgi:hypothetical protein
MAEMMERLLVEKMAGHLVEKMLGHLKKVFGKNSFLKFRNYLIRSLEPKYHCSAFNTC